jgi:hypothetical protein
MMRRFTHRNDEIANIEERPGFSVNGETRTLFSKVKIATQQVKILNSRRL